MSTVGYKSSLERISLQLQIKNNQHWQQKQAKKQSTSGEKNSNSNQR